MPPSEPLTFKPPGQSGFKQKFTQSKLGKVVRHSDFRLLWIGAFLSFTGSWVQNIAQGYYVYSITRSETMLAVVSFVWSLPVFLFGLVAGSFTDHFNKRKVLAWTQVWFACSATYLAIATWMGFVQLWQILVVSFTNGLVSCIEMPARQSIVSRVVPPEDLAAAVPVNAMTFNVARIFGPAIGAFILAKFGVAWCYFINGLSFFALIWSAFAIKADLRSHETEIGPMRDLITEGMLYTMRDIRLRTLLILEACTACFGIAYIPLIPAYAKEALGAQVVMINKVPVDEAKVLNGYLYMAVGIGALFGLILITTLSDSDKKGNIVRWAMTLLGVGLILIAFVRSLWLVLPIVAVMGCATIMQFNTTNALFQLLAPDRLRGRVLAMHIWTLNGLSPFGVLLFGGIANFTRTNPELSNTLPINGVALVMALGGLVMLVGAAAAIRNRHGLSNLA